MKKFIQEHILLPCYQATKDNSSLHERLRKMILRFEMPLILSIFRKVLGGNLLHIRARHSLLEPFQFNLFMSDIDLTMVVVSEAHTTAVLEAFYRLKKIFPNLGEPEVVTEEEWNLALSFEKKGYEKIWASLFQVRKIGWQRKKLPMAGGIYELSKIQRGLENTWKKLGGSTTGIKLETLLAEAPEARVFCNMKLPFYSHYLERWIEVGEPSLNESIVCSSEAVAQGFVQLIPGHETVDSSIKTHPLHRFLLAKEINLSLAQYRIQVHSGFENEHIRRWILRLKEELKGSLSLEEAPRVPEKLR